MIAGGIGSVLLVDETRIVERAARRRVRRTRARRTMSECSRTPKSARAGTPKLPPFSHAGTPTEVWTRVTVQARDQAWAARLVAGDEHALREVYREYAAAVLGLAARVIANESIAEEVVQEVFVRLWERPERYDATRGPLRAYLLAMTHSRAVERVRSEDSLRRRHEIAQREALREPPVVDPEHQLVDKDVSAAIRKALAGLPESQRVPIEMAYFEGMSYRQVAAALNEPEGTIKYRIRGGMQKLRTALRAAEVGP
jgi:RNA polymerase sigma-70 factor (ECF subfamily)